jgi:sugar lactone lactonase YvrE
MSVELACGPFQILVEDLDHPEGVAWSPLAGVLYAGGEAGQIYEVTLQGEVREVATTGGSLLGLALDGDGRVYACDCERCEVVRVDPRSGGAEPYSALEMILPNAAAFDDAGNLYVTDSGETKEDNGRVLRILPGGATEVWSERAPRYPNGICLTTEGEAVLVVESYLPGVTRIPILADGSAGEPETVVLLPGTVPDGVALDASGAMVVACYRPDRVVRIAAGGEPEVVAEDPQGIVLNAPTNVAFAGPQLDLMAVPNVGETHLALGRALVPGLPLRMPVLP